MTASHTRNDDNLRGERGTMKTTGRGNVADGSKAQHSDAAALIARHFTNGVHPFENVQWELRDSVLGNPKDPVFEQLGVEFPADWSQNATNIVTQKYFRGKMGSPERENSV